MDDAPPTVEVEKYVKRGVYTVIVLLTALVALFGWAVITIVQWLVSK